MGGHYRPCRRTFAMFCLLTLVGCASAAIKKVTDRIVCPVVSTTAKHPLPRPSADLADQPLRRPRTRFVIFVRHPAIQPDDASDIGAGLRKRRHALVLVHPALAGGGGGRHIRLVAPVIRQQPAQGTHAAAQVLCGIKGIAHVKTHGRVGNQLHQPGGGLG